MNLFKGKSEKEIWAIIDKYDRQAIKEGIQPKSRPLYVAPKVCEELGAVFSIGVNNDQLSKIIIDMHRSLYRKQDLQMGAAYSGLAIGLAIPFQVNVPLIYGSVVIEPLKHVEAKEVQLQRIFENEEEGKAFINQVVEAFDIGGVVIGMADFAVPDGKDKAMFLMAAFHNTAQATTLVHSSDSRGAIQSALIAAELAVKAALIRFGYSDDQLKAVGHVLSRAKPDYCKATGMNEDAFSKMVGKLPELVKSRYMDEKRTTLEFLETASICQHLVATTARYLSGKSLHSDLVSKE